MIANNRVFRDMGTNKRIRGLTLAVLGTAILGWYCFDLFSSGGAAKTRAVAELMLLLILSIPLLLLVVSNLIRRFAARRDSPSASPRSASDSDQED